MSEERVASALPLVIHATNTETKRSALFPAFAGQTDLASQNKPTSTEWLYNDSFREQDAILLHKFQQKTSSVRRSETPSTEHSDNLSDSSLERKDLEPEQEKRSSKHKLPDDIREPSEGAEGRYEAKRKRHQKKKKKEHKKHKKNKKGKKRGQSPEGSNSSQKEQKASETSSLVVPPPGKIFIEKAWNLKPEHAYRIDRKSDPNNLLFDQLYQLHIARHHRLGNICLGQMPHQVLSFGSNKMIKKEGKGNEPKRYFCEGNRKKATGTGSTDEEQNADVLDESNLDSNKIRKSRFSDLLQSDEQITLPYISLEKDKGAKGLSRNPLANPLGIYDTSTELYIQGKSPDFQVASKMTAGAPALDKEKRYQDALKEKTAEYNKHLHQNPYDVSRWLQFVDFQNVAVCSKSSSVTEIKLSIVDKALEKNPTSVPLKMKQLQIGAEVWERDRLTKEWQQLVFKHPNNADIWWQYLIFLQSNVTTFTVLAMMKAYTKCLNTLGSILDGSLQSHKAKPHTEEHLLALFCQLTRLLAQAGHTERAVALYQASLELNLFCPTVLSTANPQDKLEFLEAFWESCVPRVGENDAAGFAAWVNRKGDVPFASMANKDEDMEAEDTVFKTTTDRCSSWVAMEAVRMSRHILPWKPDAQNGESEEDCEDLERIVMFDDISSCIITLSKEANQLDLVSAFLQVLGIHCLSRSVGADPLYRRSLHPGLDSVNQVAPGCSKAAKCESVPMLPTRYDIALNVLQQILLLGAFSPHSKTRLTLALMDVKMMQLGAKQQVGTTKKQLKNLYKEVKKFMKGLLREEANRNNLLIWDAYVSMEWALGNHEDAHRALSTTMTVTPLPEIDSTSDMYSKAAQYKLYRSSAELEMGIRVPTVGVEGNSVAHGPMDQSSSSRALYILVCLAQGQCQGLSEDAMLAALPATQILRARNAYQHGLDALLLQLEDKAVTTHGAVLRLLPQVGSPLTHWTVCFALFQYLTLGMNAASNVIQNVLQVMRPESAQLGLPADEKCEKDWTDDGAIHKQSVFEELTMAHLCILQRHMTANVVPLNTLRIPLLQSLRQFPDSARLLHMYTELEKSTNIAGRLRRQLLGLSGISQTPLVWVYGAMAEMERQQRIGQCQMELSGSHFGIPEWMLVSPTPTGSLHQLRAWFERAVTSQSSCYCILLWRLFFQFELNEGKRENARAVFYRAVQKCPAGKMLYMDYARAFPDRLEEVTDLLVEKELRLRVPLEELDLLLEASVGKVVEAGVALPPTCDSMDCSEGAQQALNPVVPRTGIDPPSSVVPESMMSANLSKANDKLPSDIDVSSIPLPDSAVL